MEAAAALGSLVHSLIGSTESVKYVVSDDGSSIAISDVVDLLQNLNIEHPVGQIVYEVCHSHQTVYGTGTKTLLCLIGVWAKAAIRLLDQGVPVDDLIQLMRDGVVVILKYLDILKIQLDIKSQNKQPESESNTKFSESKFQKNESLLAVNDFLRGDSESEKYGSLDNVDSSHGFNDRVINVETAASDNQTEITYTEFYGDENADNDWNSLKNDLHTQSRKNPYPLKQNGEHGTQNGYLFNFAEPNIGCSNTDDKWSNAGLSKNKKVVESMKDFNRSSLREQTKTSHTDTISVHSQDRKDVTETNFTESDDEFSDCFEGIHLADSKPKFEETSTRTRYPIDLDSRADEPENFTDIFNRNHKRMTEERVEVIPLNLKMIISEDLEESSDDISWFFEDPFTVIQSEAEKTNPENKVADVSDDLRKADSDRKYGCSEPEVDMNLSNKAADFTKNKNDRLSLENETHTVGASSITPLKAVGEIEMPNAMKSLEQFLKFRPVSLSRMKNCSRHFKTIESSVLAHQHLTVDSPKVSTAENNGVLVIEQCVDRMVNPDSLSSKYKAKNNDKKGEKAVQTTQHFFKESVSMGSWETEINNQAEGTTDDRGESPSCESNVSDRRRQFEEKMKQKLKTFSHEKLFESHSFSRHLNQVTENQFLMAESREVKTDLLREVHVSAATALLGEIHSSVEVAAEETSETALSPVCELNTDDSENHPSYIAAASGNVKPAMVGQCTTNGKRDKMEISVESLVNGLSHGSDSAMKLVSQAFRLQQRSDGVLDDSADTLQFDLNRLHTSIVGGCSEDRSCVVEGLLVNLTPDQASLLPHRSSSTLPSLLVSGSISPTFRHKGYKPPIKNLTRFSGLDSSQPCESWTERVVRRVISLGVSLLLVSGSVDPNVRLMLESRGVLVAEDIKNNLLTVLTGTNSWQILTYVEDCTKEHVCDVTASLVDNHWGGTSDRPNLHMTLHNETHREARDIWTIVVCHPSTDIAHLRDQAVWRCAHRLSSCLASGVAVTGGGITERAIAGLLFEEVGRHQQDKDNGFRCVVFEELAHGFHEFFTLVQRNSVSQHAERVPSRTLEDIGERAESKNIHNRFSNRCCRFSGNCKHIQDEITLPSSRHPKAVTCDPSVATSTPENSPTELLDDFTSKQAAYRTALETVILLLQCDRHVVTGIDAAAPSLQNHIL